MVSPTRSDLSLIARLALPHCASWHVQGGFELRTLLTILLQVALGLQHLHRQGVIHRDLRAANVLAKCLDPSPDFCVVLSDFGLSHFSKKGAAQTQVHRRRRHGHGLAHSGRSPEPVAACHCCHSTGPMHSRLRGALSLGPEPWKAPEVRAAAAAAAANTGPGVVASSATDVYMFGGLMYELLTGGTAPFQWLVDNPMLMLDRLRSAEPVGMPGVMQKVFGMLHMNVAVAAAANDVRIPWCDVTARGTSVAAVETLRWLMSECLSSDPSARPSVDALINLLTSLLEQHCGPEANKSAGPTAGKEQQRVVNVDLNAPGLGLTYGNPPGTGVGVGFA
jgi:serine/threonine protein kinase